MAFHEVRFPDDISRGARGGPERRTQVVELASGDEERNASWANSRRRYDAAYGIRRADDLAAVIAFFEARNGRLHGFRWKDWGDYRSGLPSDAGDADRPGARHRRRRRPTAFQLVKRYESGAQAWVRRIVKPVAGTRAGRARRRRAALRLVGRARRPASSPSPPRPPPACSSPPASSSTCRCASTPTGSTSPGTSTGSARSPRSRSWRCGDERGARLRRRRPARPRRFDRGDPRRLGRARRRDQRADHPHAAARCGPPHPARRPHRRRHGQLLDGARRPLARSCRPRRCRPAAPPARPPTSSACSDRR